MTKPEFTIVGGKWIPWKGGRCPVGKKVTVDVRFSNGDEQFGIPAEIWSWSKKQTAKIIAYRLHNGGE